MQNIKVYVKRQVKGRFKKEILQAETVDGYGSNAARIATIPLTCEYGLGDIVRYDPEQGNVVVDILQKGSRTYGCLYEARHGDPVIDRGNRAGIKMYFERFGINIEFATKRLFSLAVPLNMGEARVINIVYKCPIDITVYVS